MINVHATICKSCGEPFSEDRPKSMGSNPNVCAPCNCGITLPQARILCGEPISAAFPNGRWSSGTKGGDAKPVNEQNTVTHFNGVSSSPTDGASNLNSGGVESRHAASFGGQIHTKAAPFARSNRALPVMDNAAQSRSSDRPAVLT